MGVGKVRFSLTAAQDLADNHYYSEVAEADLEKIRPGDCVLVVINNSSNMWLKIVMIDINSGSYIANASYPIPCLNIAKGDKIKLSNKHILRIMPGLLYGKPFEQVGTNSEISGLTAP
jgi:hypothetical protein